MNAPQLTNDRGVTLTELIVALGISSLLLVLIVSGALFLRNYMNQWKRQDAISEELAFVRAEFSPTIRNSRSIQAFDDSALFTGMDGVSATYRWTDKYLMKDDRRITRAGLSLDRLAIARIGLSEPEKDTILTGIDGQCARGLYRLNMVVSNERDERDSLTAIVRNNHEYYKYSEN